MGALETNTTLIYGIHIRESANDGSDFTNAAADYRIAFLGEDGAWHLKDSSGTVTTPSAGTPTFRGCKAITSGTTALTTGSTEYPIAFGGADVFDTDAFHDPSSSNTRMTAPVTGYYLIRGQTYIATNTTAYADLKVRIGGAAGTVLSHHRQSGPEGNQIIQVSCISAMTAAQYVELYASSSQATRVADSSLFEITLLGV